MEKALIKLLLKCDEINHDVKSHEDMSPSSSIKEIAEFLTSYLSYTTEKGGTE